MHRRIIFYGFLRMGKVILCSFSLSPFIIFILYFCFAEIPKNPSPTETVLGTFLPDESSLQHHSSVQCWLIWADNLCHYLQVSPKSVSTQETEQFSIPRLSGACWCAPRMRRATRDCSVHATQPCTLDLICVYPVVSISAQCRTCRNSAGRQHGSGGAKYNVLGLIAIWGESREWTTQDLCLVLNAWDVPEEVSKEKATIQQRGQLGAQASFHDLSVGHSGDMSYVPSFSPVVGWVQYKHTHSYRLADMCYGMQILET